MTRYWVAIAAVCLGAAVGIGAAGCGGDDSGDTNSITVPSIETEIRTSPAPSTTPTDEGLPTAPETTPNVTTTPPKATTPNPGGASSGGGGSAEQNFNNYCKQYPGACGD